MLRRDLTAIVPLDLSQRPFDLIRKAVLMAKTAEKHGLKVIFGHNDRGALSDRFLALQLKKYACTTLISGRHDGDGVNTSMLRNKAFAHVKTDYLALLDVDIWTDIRLFYKYQQRVVENIQPFYFLPCIYLTPRGSRDLMTGKSSPEKLSSRFFAFSRKEFLHVASPSSVTIMRTSDYETIGCFDESFTGHGYEDFDFMIRLANHYRRLTPCADFLNNTTARSPLFASGFRRALGRLCLPTLMEKDFAYHLHHEKPRTSRYYLSRPDNFARFRQLNQALQLASSESSTLLEDFLDICREKHRNFHDYSALFENKPGHIDRYDTFKRRLRFLLNE